MVAWLLCRFANRPYLPTLAVILGVALLAGAVALTWATRWALDDHARLSQWTLGVAMFATLCVATWLGAMRWLWLGSVQGLPGQLPSPQAAFDRTVGLVVLSIVLSLISLIFLVGLVEGLVWRLAWLVRRSWVQRVFRRRTSRSTRERNSSAE